MGFCFKRKESVPKAVRRATRERVEDAIECLKSSDRGEAIHCARKDIKKVRALLRLVETNVSKEEFRAISARLRKAAASLAGPRDAYIKAKTLRGLAQRYKSQLAPEAFRRIRATLRDAERDALNRFAREGAASQVARKLREVGTALKRLEVGGKGWKSIRPGIKATYREGRIAYRLAQKDQTPEKFHAWRKRAKNLLYQIHMMRRVWPEQIDALIHELDTLGEFLGEDHDLLMLHLAFTGGRWSDGIVRELETLAGLIRQRQRELREAALALGARLFSEKPSAFSNRLAGYWEIWRGKKRQRQLV